MKLFVWDFHGVLEKGTSLSALEISNIVLSESGFEDRFSEDVCNKLFGLKWYEYFEYLLPHESHEKHLELQELCFNHALNNSEEFMKSFIRPNDFAHEVLSMIEDSNHRQILISNTKPEKLKKFIDYVKMNRFFNSENSFGVDDHLKNSKRTKLEVLDEYISNKNFDEIIIIGDSPSDMLLKQVAGGKTYLYSYVDRIPRVCEADYKINDLRVILKEI